MSQHLSKLLRKTSVPAWMLLLLHITQVRSALLTTSSSKFCLCPALPVTEYVVGRSELLRSITCFHRCTIDLAVCSRPHCCTGMGTFTRKEWDHLLFMLSKNPLIYQPEPGSEAVPLSQSTPPKPIPRVSTGAEGLLNCPSQESICSLSGPCHPNASLYHGPLAEGPATPTHVLSSGVLLSPSDDSYGSPASSFSPSMSTSPLLHQTQVCPSHLLNPGR